MGRRAQSVRGAQKPFTKLGVLLQQLMVGQRVCRLRLATGGFFRIRRARPDFLRNTRIFWRWSHVGISWFGGRRGRTIIADYPKSYGEIV